MATYNSVFVSNFNNLLKLIYFKNETCSYKNVFVTTKKNDTNFTFKNVMF